MGEGLFASNRGIDGGFIEQIEGVSLGVNDGLVLVVVVIAVAQRVEQRQVQIRYVVRWNRRAARRHA